MYIEIWDYEDYRLSTGSQEYRTEWRLHQTCKAPTCKAPARGTLSAPKLHATLSHSDMRMHTAHTAMRHTCKHPHAHAGAVDREFFDFRCWFSLCFHSQYFRDPTLYHVFFAIGAIAWCFSYFLIPSQLKHLVLRAFLAGNLPKKLSNLDVLDERGMKKSKEHCTGLPPESLLL